MAGTQLDANVDALIRTLEVTRSLSGKVEAAAKLIATALKNGHKLLTCGNGGSAADAMHLATEFVSKFDQDRAPLPCICLNASGGDLTAIGNDYAYEQVFARQVRAYGRPKDVLIVFSSSGQSRNVLLALQAATEIGLSSIAFLGKGGGFTAGKASLDILVPASVTARVQETQKLLLHTMCELVEVDLAAG